MKNYVLGKKAGSAMSLENKDKITLVVTTIFFLISSLVVKLSGFSTESVVNIQNTILRNMFVQTQGTFEALGIVLAPFVSIFLSLLFLSLGFAVLSSYGFYKNDNRTGAIAGIIGAVIYIAIFGPTISSLAFAVGVFVASYYIIALSNTYGKELKKWIRYRTGSNSVGSSLFVFNIILALGIFIAVITNVSVYQESFRQDLNESILAVVGDVPGIDVSAQIDKALNESPLFASYFRWLPVFTAFGAWIILEFLRSVILSNVSGVATNFIIRKKD